MVHFKYRNAEPLGDMIFPTGFWSEFYVDTILEKPQYPVQEETREDEEGDVHRLFQRWEKQYVVSFKAVESLCDACSMLRLMDEVYVNNMRVFDIFTDIVWDEEEGDCFASVTITFLTRKVIKV